MDISKQLQAYEVEYHVLQEELIDSSPLSDNQRMDKLEKTNSSLRKQNLDLLEQLQVEHIYEAASCTRCSWEIISAPEHQRPGLSHDRGTSLPLRPPTGLFIVGIKGIPGELVLFIREHSDYPPLRSDSPGTF